MQSGTAHNSGTGAISCETMFVTASSATLAHPGRLSQSRYRAVANGAGDASVSSCTSAWCIDGSALSLRRDNAQNTIPAPNTTYRADQHQDCIRSLKKGSTSRG